MRIVFLCGSLEPGRDGVGDYVRRLAAELMRQDHKAAAIALNDKFITEELVGTQFSEGVDLPVMRVPAALPAKQRFSRAKAWIDELNPDWLSLQFVIFSFHPKGLPFKLSKLMNKLGSERRWHIMFHELWVGMDSESSQKQALWGMVQRKLIKSLLSSLQPIVIHTQTKLYQTQLEKLGYSAVCLPLFSNVPAVAKIKTPEPVLGNSPLSISWVIFGSIHSGAPIEQLAAEAFSYSCKHNLRIVLTLVGRCGPEQDTWANSWRSAGMPVEILGEQSLEQISEVLANASAGITTTPIALVEKSGSVAAMRAHGLPVLCVSRSWQPRGIQQLQLPYGVAEYKIGNLEVFFENEKDVETSSNQVVDVSQQLLNKLSIISI